VKRVDEGPNRPSEPTGLTRSTFRTPAALRAQRSRWHAIHRHGLLGDGRFEILIEVIDVQVIDSGRE
jgi:hypothetical protein